MDGPTPVRTYGGWHLIPAEARQQFQRDMEEWQAKVRSGYYWHTVQAGDSA